jgi:hypothetical protein
VQVTAEIRLIHPSTPGDDAEARMLDREFGANALAGLREAVLGCATACGMAEDRAIDVMLVVHELAANAVCHGAGGQAPALRARCRGRSSKATAFGSYTKPPTASPLPENPGKNWRDAIRKCLK